MNRIRAGGVAVASLLLALLVVGTALVEAYGMRAPERAAIWSGHPEVILASGLAEVGDAAAAGRPVDQSLVRRLVEVYRKAPLAPEPFLVRGVDAQLAGNEALAGRAFIAARDRNPREVAARYFLAEHFLRTGRIPEGLAEISALARLVPQSLPHVAPYLAAYARTPGTAPQVRAMISRQPQLETALMQALAVDANNLGLILELWTGSRAEEAQAWQRRLLVSLAEAGRYAEARAAWARFSGTAPPRNQLFDPDFSASALPPFGWSLASGPAGVAEPQGGGQLHVIYYGREDAVLAQQLLTLSPGDYQLAMRIGGASPAAKSVAWRVRCLPSARLLASTSLDRVSRGQVAMPFEVPAAGCTAQQLELVGIAPEFPAQADLTISSLRLSTGSRQ